MFLKDGNVQFQLGTHVFLLSLLQSIGNVEYVHPTAYYQCQGFIEGFGSYNVIMGSIDMWWSVSIAIALNPMRQAYGEILNSWVWKLIHKVVHVSVCM